jgi:two-component system sensor histidine kinase DesK
LPTRSLPCWLRTRRPRGWSATALLVGVFLWLVWRREPLEAGAVEASEVRKRRVAVAFLTALAFALTFVYGGGQHTLFVPVSIAAGTMLPRREAYVTIASLAAITLGLGLALGEGWLDAARFVLPTIALGLLFVTLARHITTIAELRAAREEIARLAVAEERLRFARDVHDLLGHSLSLITLKSELAGRLLPPIPEAKMALKEIRDVEGVARGALREVREAVADYRRPTLDEELTGAREILEAAGIASRVENGAGSQPGATDAVLAWAVREGVTNVIPHSRARRCEIKLWRDGEEIYAEITDDGVGSSPAGDGIATGSGLSGLAERVAGSGGDFEARALPEGGFRLRVSLPLRDRGASSAEPVSEAASVREDERR